MDEEIKERVFSQIQLCMMTLVGGSGHLASYSLVPDTFHITGVEQLERGFMKYYFSAEAYYESEFTVYDENHQPKSESISGSIVLDKDFRLVRDEKGRVMLEPWNCHVSNDLMQ